MPRSDRDGQGDDERFAEDESSRRPRSRARRKSATAAGAGFGFGLGFALFAAMLLAPIVSFVVCCGGFGVWVADLPKPSKSEAKEVRAFNLAAGPVVFRDLQIDVDASVGPMQAVDRQGDPVAVKDADRCLNLRVTMSNLTVAKKIDYKSWSDPTHPASLKDTNGNRYRRTRPPFGSRLAGAVEDEAIMPGRSVVDVLCFEEPVENAILELSLPLANLGMSKGGLFDTEEITISIPWNLVRRPTR